MPEIDELKLLLRDHAPLTAMVAPSFAIMYDAAELIAKLKKLGFAQVVEVAAGADLTNQAVIKVLTADPKSRFITSPCPSIVRMVRTKYPELKPYLAFAADSPMVATTRLVQEKFPGTRPIFIGPCNVKRLEANEDYPELQILSITYRDLESLWPEFGIGEVAPTPADRFALACKKTRLYPISGGLAQSSEVGNILANDEIEVVSGWQHAEAALQRFKTNDRVRLLDILFCDGGCINGPGIVSQLSLAERRDRIADFWQQQFMWEKQIDNALLGQV